MFRGCEGPKPMKLLQSVEELSSVTGPIHLAIGVFDGIHLGHQSVINRASAAAARGGGTSVVLTFHPHPVRVLRPEKAPRLLTSTLHKVKLIELLGVDAVLILEFTAEFSKTAPNVFIEKLAWASNRLS